MVREAVDHVRAIHVHPIGMVCEEVGDYVDVASESLSVLGQCAVATQMGELRMKIALVLFARNIQQK